MKKLLSLVLCLALVLSFASIFAFAEETAEGGKIKVACVGDSITAGTNSTNYPMYLQEILGDGYEVKNFGLGGAAVRHQPESNGTYFWYDSTQYKSSLEYDADVVFVMMGTNDVGSNVLTLKKYFKEDYYNYLIKPYLDNGSKVVMMTSPYAYYYMMADHMRINTTIRQYQIELAEEKGLQIIDMNTATADMRECFPDGLHGNASGYSVIAQTIYEALFKGVLADITVHTTPGAEVKIGRVLRTADQKGDATLRVIPATHELFITLENYKTASGVVTVPEGKSEVTHVLTEGGKNVAKNKTATASTDISGNYPIKAVDGKMDTRWESAGANNQWICVDLGKETQIGGARVYWEGAYGKQYSLEVSNDNLTWTSVYDIDDFAGGTDEIIISPVTARYVRLNCKVRGTIFSFSIYEFQILESDGGEIVDKNLNLVATPIVETSSEGDLMGGNNNLLAILLIAGGGILAVIIFALVLFAVKGKKKK